MGWFTARRRQRAAGYAVVVLALAAVGLVYASLNGRGSEAAATSGSAQTITQGRNLFDDTCSSCHGLDAQGSARAPSLIGAGAAAVDFQMSTGRMPAKEVDAEEPPKEVLFTRGQIDAIAAYVASLGGGPPIPSAAQVSTGSANVGLGQELFAANCAACHNIDGAGGALTYGKYAPALNKSTPTEIYEAMETGPEAMPVFGDGVVSPALKRDIIAYVTQTRSMPNPGGFSLGRVGPTTEGLVAWIGGIGLLILCAIWIAGRRHQA